jgi:hypothetical protein
VLNDFRRHPEAKFNGPYERPCGPDTVGLLNRRCVRLGKLHFLGKESNDVEEREFGQALDLDDVQTEYVMPARAWHAMPDELVALVDAKGVAGAARELGVDERTVRRRLRR